MLSTISTIIIDPPEGHMATYLRELERLLARPMTTLYPAHGPAHREGPVLIKHFLAHRRAREQKVREALSAEPQSLEALLPGSGIDAQKIINEASDMGGAKKPTDPGKSLDDKNKAKIEPEASASRGKNTAIVLMSDGQSNMGPELLKMAELAAKHEVKVYTVGIGTPEGDVVQMQGRSMRVKLEDEALKKVSSMTQGEYFRADSTEGLKNVYDKLGYKLRFEKRSMSEISAQVALLGMLLVMFSAIRALARSGRIL
jgi:Ca-activated chloride channel family protein